MPIKLTFINNEITLDASREYCEFNRSIQANQTHVVEKDIAAFIQELWTTEGGFKYCYAFVPDSHNSIWIRSKHHLDQCVRYLQQNRSLESLQQLKASKQRSDLDDIKHLCVFGLECMKDFLEKITEDKRKTREFKLCETWQFTVNKIKFECTFSEITDHSQFSSFDLERFNRVLLLTPTDYYIYQKDGYTPFAIQHIRDDTPRHLLQEMELRRVNLVDYLTKEFSNNISYLSYVNELQNLRRLRQSYFSLFPPKLITETLNHFKKIDYEEMRYNLYQFILSQEKFLQGGRIIFMNAQIPDDEIKRLSKLLKSLQNLNSLDRDKIEDIFYKLCAFTANLKVNLSNLPNDIKRFIRELKVFFYTEPRQTVTLRRASSFD